MGLRGISQNLAYRMQRLMAGRNGIDQLFWALLAVSTLASLAASLAGLPWLMGLYYAGLAVSIFRVFSRNIYKRQRENWLFVLKLRAVAAWFRLQRRIFSERKTHRYFMCASCRQRLRVPKGKGRVSIRCTRCGVEIIKKV